MAYLRKSDNQAVILYRINQNKFVFANHLYRVVNGDSYLAVQYVNQLDFLVPMIRLRDFALLDFNPRRKVAVVSDSLKYTVHNTAPSAVLKQETLSQSTSLHVSNYNIFKCQMQRFFAFYIYKLEI